MIVGHELGSSELHDAVTGQSGPDVGKSGLE